MIRYGSLEIFNTDQGSPFTRIEFTDVLKTAKTQTVRLKKQLHHRFILDDFLLDELLA